MKFRRLIRQLHRWLALLIGLQLFLWVCGGLIMSALRLEEVRGDDRVAQRPLAPLDAERPLLAPGEVLRRQQGEAVTSLSLTMLLSQPVYRVQVGDSVRLLDARTGMPLSPLTADQATALARADYDGAAAVAGTDWVVQPELEFRGRAPPLWRVRFDDARNTALYVSPFTGEVVARRNDLWRVFDFVWMLHIMDYREREDFNHPLLVMAAATALLFVTTGITMLVLSFRRGGPKTLR